MLVSYNRKYRRDSQNGVQVQVRVLVLAIVQRKVEHLTWYGIIRQRDSNSYLIGDGGKEFRHFLSTYINHLSPVRSEPPSGTSLKAYIFFKHITAMAVGVEYNNERYTWF